MRYDDLRNLRDWYRSRISEKQREASALSIELKLDAEDQEELGALAEAMEGLDAALKILEGARSRVAT